MKTKEITNTKIIISDKGTFEINNKMKRTPHMMKMSSLLSFKLLPLLIYLITIQQMTMMIICVNGLTVGVENSPIILNADTNTNNPNNNGRHQSMDTMNSIEIMKMMNAKHQEEGFDKISGNNLRIEQQQHITATNNGRMKNSDDYGISNAMKDAKMLSSSMVPEIYKEEILITTSSHNPAIESKSVLTDSTLGNELPFNSNAKRNVGNNDISSSNVLLQNNEKNDEIFECGSPQNLHKGKFTGYDYAIVLAMLIISLGIGAFYGFFHKSSKDSNPDSSNEFLLGTQMSTFTVTLSLTTSFITAIELLGNPSEMFYQGTQFSLIVIPMVLVIPVATKMFYPIYYKLDLTSCYEYLGIRFGKDLRMMGAILYIIQMSFYTAVAVLAPAIALSKATGLNTRLAVALIYIVCIFYSSQGGMKAVVIADTFQACVLAGSLVLIVILGTYYTGNAITIFETASEHNRLEFFNFDPNPTTRHTLFSVVIGGFFYWASLFCTNQASVQKCMSLKSLTKAKLALIFAIIGLIIVFLINFYTGLMVFTHYSQCDPLSSGQIEATDQLLPFYIMNVYGNIYTISGIFVAGIFAASLGTVASALNSLAAVTCEDILTNGFNIKLRPEQGALYAKWMSLGFGVFSFILVFVVERLGGVLQATLTLNGLVGGVTLGLFVLGIVFKRANAKGAFYGGIIALVLVIYIGVMAQITNVDPKPLSKSIEGCNCFVSNRTLYDSSSSDGLDFLSNNDNKNNNVKMEAKYHNFHYDDNEKIILNDMIPTTTIATNVVVNDSLVNPTTTVKTIIEKNILITGDKIINYDDNNNNNNDNNHINNVNKNYENNNSYNNNDNITTNNNNSNSNNRSDYYDENHIDDRLGKINDDTLNKDDNDQGFSFSSIYRISYMWYSMIGALLTIIFGLIISIIYDKINEHRILKITKRNQQKENHCYDNNDIKMNTTSNFHNNISNGSNYNHNNDTNQNYDKQQQKSFTLKLNENLRLAHSNKQTSMTTEQQQLHIPQKFTLNKSDCGIDNYALKIDDEK